MLWAGLLCLLLCAVRAEDGAFPAISVTAERSVDTTSQIVKIIVKYEITNKGKQEINSFIHLVTGDEQSKLAFITAAEEKKDGKLRVAQTSVPSLKKGFTAYKVELLSSVAPEAKISATVEYHLAQYLEPFPAKITQAESQFVVYKGNAHVASVYSVAQESTTVVLPQGKVLSFTTVSPSKNDGSKITYGPYRSQKPYAFEEIKIHNENNSPFVIATDVERVIEISHWGNVAIEENIYLVHKGAELKGSFSRLDFQLDRRGNKRPVVTQYKTLLPATAKDIYYRDEIGNISTSTVRKMTDAVEVTIQPRFPLFGGWRTNYLLGYNVPAYQYLFSSGNAFALKIRLMDHLFDNSVVEHLKVKVILPEGSRNFKLVTPYSVKRLPDELHFTYLDVTGRPVIVLEKHNLVDAHIQPFTVHYEFDRLHLWYEPLLACAAFAALFLAVIIYVRLDFTIVEDTNVESRLKAQGHIEKLDDLHVDRMKTYDEFSDIASKYKNHKDSAEFATARKKAEAELKNITQAFTDVQTNLKPANSDIADKINEVQKLNKAAQEVINTYLTQTERLVKSQGTKNAFADAEKTYTRKIDEIKEKMDAIINSLVSGC